MKLQGADAAARADAVLREIQPLGSEHNRAGMARYGINTENAFGVPIPPLRKLARSLRPDHALALALWDTGNHEGRILAAFVDDPGQVGKAQMNRWAADFDSWDVCDQVCNNLFVRTPHAYDRALKWSGRKAPFVRRAAFSLMASLAVHAKNLDDRQFDPLLRAIEDAADDERNYVKKAVNWALRQIGKRNRKLHTKAIAVAEDLAERPSKSARWIARDALRELTGEKVKARLHG